MKTGKFIMPAVVAVVLVVVLTGSSLALRPEREYRATPDDYGIIHRDAHIMTADSVCLAGWFFPAQDTTGIANRVIGHHPVEDFLRVPAREYEIQHREPRPTVVICNGDGGNMTWLIMPAYHLFTHGYNVLVFDWRGFGASDDWPMNPDMLCLTEFLEDYRAAIKWVTQQPEVDSSAIGVFGYSTGAYLSFAMAASDPNVTAFAGRGLISSFDDVVPILQAIDPDRPVLVPEDYPSQLQPINAAESFDKPAFIIVGENDRRSTPDMASRVYEALKGPKELWVVEGAGHGGANAPEYVNYPEFFVRLATFFDEHLKTR